MKLCYILPKYTKENAENFYHIVNFLEVLGKVVDIYLIIEETDFKKVSLKNIKLIAIVNEKRIIFRFLKFIKFIWHFKQRGVRIYFVRSSLVALLPVIFSNFFIYFKKGKVIFWSCGQDIVPLNYKVNKKNFKRLISKVLFRISLKLIDFLATGPEIMKSYYEDVYKVPNKKIINLYNDISLNRFYQLDLNQKKLLRQNILNTKNKIILYVHTINRARGADLLHKIGIKIKENKINCKLVIIGRQGDYSTTLKDEINSYGLQNVIINLGQIPNKDIHKFYQVSDLFIMPSRGEGFPRVIIESMASGCPTLSFNVGGIKNIIPEKNHDSLIIDSFDEEKFIKRTLELINDNNELKRLSEDSLDFVKKFSTEEVAKMYYDSLNLINESLNSPA